MGANALTETTAAAARMLLARCLAVISSAAFVRWKPSAFDEKRVAGRFWTDGTNREFGQQWSYDATFSAPITLDPAARSVPKK